MKAKCEFNLRLIWMYAFWMCWCYIPVASKKSKRVVGGEPLLERDPSMMPYDSVRWFAWIGDSGKTCSHSWWDRYGKAVWDKHCPPIASDLECGGALVTPFIIQTACHCISIWDFADKVDYSIKQIPWLPARVVHFWEDRKDVYLGYNQVDKFEYYTSSLAFFVHQKCAQMTKNYAGITTHDFGWIRLNKPLWDTEYNDAPGFYIDYPPLYTENSLRKLSQEALLTQAFCLVIGFGYNDNNQSSNVLKHAWTQLVDYQTCFRVVFTYRELDIGWGVKNLTDGETWVCARPGLGHIGGRHAPSDSGGPITCNKHYLFLNSASGYILQDDEDFPPVGDITWFMIEAALIHALRENAYEFREAFMNEVWTKDPSNPLISRNLEDHSPGVFSAAPRAISAPPRAISAAASSFVSRSDKPGSDGICLVLLHLVHLQQYMSLYL